MITVNKANPTPGEITSSLTGSTGDGQGLHFDGAGNIDIASPPDLGTAFSFEFVLKADSWPASGSNIYIVDYGNGGRFVLGNPTTGNFSVRSVTGDWISFGSPVLDDLTVHHIVVTVDGTSAIAYDNGNQIGTATINSPNIDSCADARIGSDYVGTASFFNGTIYRARFWNKTLSSTEVQTAFERADVDFSSQYGSQGSPYTSNFSSGTDSFSSYGGAAVAHSGSQINITSFGATGRGIYRSLTFSEPNKKYRVKLTGSVAAGTKNIGIGIASAGADDAANRITLTTTPTTHTIEVTYPSGSQINVASQDAVDTTVSITSLVIEQIGAVTDLDLAFASPSQSLTVQDRAGSADGTCSASGVTQVQPVVQVNSTSARIGTTAATPADNQLIIGSGGSGGTASAHADELLIDNNGNSGITIASGTSDYGGINFSDSGNNSAGIVRYDHSDDSLKLYTQTTPRLTIASTGHVSMTSSDAAAQLTITPTGTNANGILNFIPPGTGRAILQYGGTEALSFNNSGVTFANGITVSGGITTLGSFSELTIASGGITVTSSIHSVDTEGDAASDNLNTINGGSTGSILILSSADSSRDVTLKDDSDNLKLNGDCVLGSWTSTITLVKNGSVWRELSRSSN